MKHLFILILVIIGGMGLSVEAGLLGPLGERVGHLSATLSIFGVGAILLSLILVFSPRPNFPQLFNQPRWLLLGGILGPVYVIVLTFATPVVGVGVTMVGILSGQIAVSLVIDHFGLLGSERRSVDRYRVGALILIIAALLLM